MKSKAFLKLIRLREIGPLSAFTPFASAFMATGVNMDWVVLPVMFSVLAIASYGFAVNNIFDVELDKFSNRPSKNPISTGDIPLSQAYKVSILLAALAIGSLYFQPLTNICLGISLIFLYHTYSMKPRIKEHPPFDVIYHTLLWAIPIAMGYLAYKPPDVTVAILFVISCSLSAVSEFINQIIDYETDMAGGIKTTAMLIGREGSLKLCMVLTIGAFLLVMPLYGLGAIHLIIFLFTSLACYFIVNPMNEASTSKNYTDLEKVYQRGTLAGLVVVNLLIFTELYLG